MANVRFVPIADISGYPLNVRFSPESGYWLSVSFRANVLWEKAAIVDADFLCHEIVQQLIHPQNRRPVLLRLKRQVVHFLGVALQIEKLNVIVPDDFPPTSAAC